MPMFNRFTERARKVILLAKEEAKRFNHDYIGTEHILLGLVREGEGVAAAVLASFGLSPDQPAQRLVRANVRPILWEMTRFSGEAMQIGRTGLPLARNGHRIARGQGRSSTQTRTPLTTDARTRRDRVGYREEFSFSCTTTRI